jgi:feruloyl-CoA synthase
MTNPTHFADAPLRPVELGPADVQIERRPDGTILARSPHPLPKPARTVTDWLEQWAVKEPGRYFLAQRDGAGPWHSLTYAQTRHAARAIAGALMSRSLSAQRPIAVLSANDLGQALIMLAGQYIGVPVAPVSPAYSLMASDFGRLRVVLDNLSPGLVYVASGAPFAKALAAVVPKDVEVVYGVDAPVGRERVTALADLIATGPSPAVDAANAIVGPDTVAKFLFTSGSTGVPKGVINTQRMLTSDIEMITAGMPFVRATPPVLVDWLPWSHTFAGNHNFHLVLRHGGTLYIDEGRPLPGAIETTVRNLKEIAPTVYFNVPRGFEMLLPRLEADKDLARLFFSRLQAMFYAGAALPQHIWDGLQRVAVATTGERVAMISGLGSTETAPGAIGSTAKCVRSGMVGLPLPGVDLKLVPNAGKLEARIKGPNVTPGYWKQPEITKAAFDQEGFYKLGDALRFVDEKDPSLGFWFDGRVAEDFKLTSGTWVSVGSLRTAVVSACAPLVRDAVIAGHDRDAAAALLIPELEACRTAAGLPAAMSADEVYGAPRLRDVLHEMLKTYNAAAGGSSHRIARAAILTAPLSIDAGELTDKGSINQRAVLARHAPLVEAIYAAKPATNIIVV